MRPQQVSIEPEGMSAVILSIRLVIHVVGLVDGNGRGTLVVSIYPQNLPPIPAQYE